MMQIKIYSCLLFLNIYSYTKDSTKTKKPVFNVKKFIKMIKNSAIHYLSKG